MAACVVQCLACVASRCIIPALHLPNIPGNTSNILGNKRNPNLNTCRSLIDKTDHKQQVFGVHLRPFYRVREPDVLNDHYSSEFSIQNQE